MKHIALKPLLCIALFVSGLFPATVQADGNRGHHQSGIIGRVQLEQSSLPLSWQVRVSTDRGEAITVLQPDEDGQFAVNLKPGTYRLTAFAPVWLLYYGVPMYAEFSGPPVQVTVSKKDFTAVEVPLAWQDSWPGWPELPGWPPGWDLEIYP